MSCGRTAPITCNSLSSAVSFAFLTPPATASHPSVSSYLCVGLGRHDITIRNEPTPLQRCFPVLPPPRLYRRTRTTNSLLPPNQNHHSKTMPSVRFVTCSPRRFVCCKSLVVHPFVYAAVTAAEGSTLAVTVEVTEERVQVVQRDLGLGPFSAAAAPTAPAVAGPAPPATMVCLHQRSISWARQTLATPILSD